MTLTILVIVATPAPGISRVAWSCALSKCPIHEDPITTSLLFEFEFEPGVVSEFPRYTDEVYTETIRYRISCNGSSYADDPHYPAFIIHTVMIQYDIL